MNSPKCPAWCTVGADGHAAEAANATSSWYFHTGRQPLSGGTVTLEYCEGFDGVVTDPPSIHVDSNDIGPADARGMAAALAAAANLLEGSVDGGVR